MGLIVKELSIRGDVGSAKAHVLFDTGASMSFVRKALASKVATILRAPESMIFQLGDGHGTLEAKEEAILRVTINGCEISDNFMVVDRLADDIIIGAKTLQGWRIKLDMEHEEVIIDPKVSQMRLVSMNTLRSRHVVPERARWTYSAYCALTPPDCYGYELLRGRLVVSPSPKRSHQRVSGNLFATLRDHVLRHDLGEVYIAPFDVILDPDNPDPEIVVEPDILFVSRARLDIITEKNVMGTPDLVVEILSSGGERRDLVEKAEIYAAAGVPHYWVFDPDARTVETFALDGDVYRKTGAFKEHGRIQPALFPGLTIRLDKVW